MLHLGIYLQWTTQATTEESPLRNIILHSKTGHQRWSDTSLLGLWCMHPLCNRWYSLHGETTKGKSLEESGAKHCPAVAQQFQEHRSQCLHRTISPVCLLRSISWRRASLLWGLLRQQATHPYSEEGFQVKKSFTARSLDLVPAMVSHVRKKGYGSRKEKNRRNHVLKLDLRRCR